MNQDRSITAAAGDTPGSADAGAGADRAARHAPLDPDSPFDPEVPLTADTPDPPETSAASQTSSGPPGTSVRPGSPEGPQTPARPQPPARPHPPARPQTADGLGGREKAAASSGAGQEGSPEAAVYRTPGGWRVGDEELPDLVSAMVFADLLVSELPSSAKPTARGTTADTGDTETARLRMTIAQLEHALANRVRVEQAIGVLSERHRVPARQAFGMLRAAARSRGRRVQELADEVLSNVTNPLLPVAGELARPATAPRARSRSRSS